jgi:hypothetical protein
MIEKTKEIASKTVFVLIVLNLVGLLIAKGFSQTVIENVKKKIEIVLKFMI